ncbi:CDGSH iron-sulfur domain-containing protein 3, mitochondrial-like isoform X2 [Periophthalmus magnuspinnatus]|uniref:CDGSH iron-sulfur domain-containing protein 3, mitochondrial-like isoform X2 n=1 Tax=Periophthalmus magnuspinnatus TaxID=409849 RepID=UPI0024367896|nr:CDGSH iron-sulfur domain-containing protein 3, mitochondrial-like isoform X2 [Periophthalmus magnuspinnatus]
MQTLTRLDHIWTNVTLKCRWKRTTTAFKLCTYPPEPVIPVKKPFKVDVVGGKWYSWCTCGYSKKQPFCDGAHKLKAPSFTPLRFVPDKDMTIYLCGCKYTNNPPYCDGTHKQDFIMSAPLYEEKDS